MTRLSACLALGLFLGALPGCRSLPAAPPAEQRARETLPGKTFVLLMLTDNPPQLDDAAAAELQRRHLAHIEFMVRSGKVAMAGPFAQRDDERLRGALIFDCSIDEARMMASADPAVKAGRLRVVCMQWMAEPAPASPDPSIENLRR